MSQTQVLEILKYDRKFWSVKDIALVCNISERAANKNLESLSNSVGVITRYETVKYGVRKTYKYDEV